MKNIFFVIALLFSQISFAQIEHTHTICDVTTDVLFSIEVEGRFIALRGAAGGDNVRFLNVSVDEKNKRQKSNNGQGKGNSKSKLALFSTDEFKAVSLKEVQDELNKIDKKISHVFIFNNDCEPMKSDEEASRQ